MVAILTDQRIAGGFAELIEIGRSVIGQVAVLGAAPHGLHRVEIRRVGRKPLDRQPISALLLEESRRFAMNIEAIQNDDQLAANLPMQMPQEGHDIGGYDVAGIELPVGIDALPLGGKRYRADSRQAIVSGPGIQRRSFAARSPSPAIYRL